jgi:beta-glucosidase
VLLARAEEAARRADVAVLVIGTTGEVETEGLDRADLGLPGRQDELVRRVLAANPRTVVVVNSGAPVLLPWVDDAPTVLQVWFAGQEAGHALADVLTGIAEPGGRLPSTWPRSAAGLPSHTPLDGMLLYREDLAIGYRSPAVDVLFPFGHGLGYGDIRYTDLAVAGSTDLEVRVELANAAHRPAKEVVQVYASLPASGVWRPERWLVGAAVVRLDAGERRTVTIPVPAVNLSYWSDVEHRWVLEPGAYTIAVGSSLHDLHLTAGALVAPSSEEPENPLAATALTS